MRSSRVPQRVIQHERIDPDSVTKDPARCRIARDTGHALIGVIQACMVEPILREELVAPVSRSRNEQCEVAPVYGRGILHAG